MRILLDECLDENLRYSFLGHDCQSCRFAGLKGLKNGQLLDAAEILGFDVLVTANASLPYQQRIPSRRVTVVVLEGRSTILDDLLPIIPDLLAILDQAQPGEVLRIGPPKA